MNFAWQMRKYSVTVEQQWGIKEIFDFLLFLNIHVYLILPKIFFLSLFLSFINGILGGVTKKLIIIIKKHQIYFEK